MRRKLSKKQIGAMGLAVMMGVQTPAMAAETTQELQESTTQENVLEPQTEEAETEQADTVEPQTEEVNATELQTEEVAISTEDTESQAEEISEQVGQAEQETEAEAAVLAAEEDGWHQNDDGSRYYIKDGEILKYCVEKIGDSYYGFDDNGVMYADCEFSIWNGEIQKSDDYRAKADGSLYVNEWHVYDEWNKYYYGADGKRYSGFQTIDGKQYYFGEWGGLYINTVVAAEDGKYYFCDEDGVATERTLANNAWTEVDGNHYYVKDGALLRNCIEKIGDFYYGFNSNGAMCADDYFSFWNEETEMSDYYRAKADGTLYVNEWYVADDSNENPYYYGADGKAYVGLKEVDGILYCFKYNGERYQNTTATVDGKSYYCDADGTVTELSEGWNQINGKRVYVKDGVFVSNCVLKIDDNYYGFDYSGNLYTDTNFSIWDAEMGGYVNYRAKADGSLYVNEWYSQLYSIGERKYYYGEDGQLVRGFKTIDGKQYYFDTNYMLVFDTAFYVDGKSYYSFEDGTVIELSNDGWNKIGEESLYVKDGQILKNCVVQINGAYYGFSDKGFMYRDTTFFLRNENNGWDYYWASPSGALYTNTWSSDAYANYYGADAKKCKGVQIIDGVQYAFDNSGSLVLSEAFTENGVNYYCDAEGRMTEMPNNQWYKGDNEAWYYVQDGTLLKGCTVQIGGTWYQFSSLGRLDTSELNANADGSLRVNTWVYDGTYWHYYGADGQMYQYGLYEIAGAKYYFTSGNMAVSDIVQIDGQMYVADANGYLTLAPETGWILVGSDYYYAQYGTLLRGDIQKINGAYYAFDYNGKMYANGEFKCGSVTCRARADGSLYASQWYQAINGNWYYYGEDAARVTGMAKINGVSYLFNPDGILKINGVVQAAGKCYLADENGIWVQTPGWVLKGGIWYYVQSDGSLYQGILKDGGYTYYMNPRMVTNSEREVIDGTPYTIDASGHVSIASDGFYYSGLLNHLYYMEDGKLAEEGWKQINGSTYYFQKDVLEDAHWALSGGIYRIENKYYRFNSDGTLAVDGWYLDSDGKWYYSYETGELATGDVSLNGTVYHFANNGELKTGILVENGTCSLYSDDGTLLETGAAQGWNLLGGSYYYLRGDSLLKNGEYKLADGKWYSFDKDGRMKANIQDSIRWYGESGAAQTGWIKLGETWYYASEVDGRLYKGLHVINGVTYYFDKKGAMRTGQVVVGNDMLTFDDNGAMIATNPMPDGWTYSSNYDRWLYYQNGKPYTGWVGSYFIRSGYMLFNTSVDWKGKTYYLGEDGAYLTNAWYDGIVYLKADGTRAQSEWLEIDGKMYYFNSIGRNVKFIDDDVTTENGVYTEDGVYLPADDYAQGWVLIDGTYYYKDGENFIVNQTKKINGDWYLFDVHGKMVTGFSMPEKTVIGWTSYEYDQGKFYYGQDGRRCYYIGWRVIDGKWYYFDTASEAASGWQIINGVRYYFDTTSHAMVTGYRVINEKLYYFDANGACYGVSGPQTGWYQADGNWYYIQGGRVVKGSAVINNTLYEFDENGVWISE